MSDSTSLPNHNAKRSSIFNKIMNESDKEMDPVYKKPLIVRIFTNPIFALGLLVGIAVLALSVIALAQSNEALEKSQENFKALTQALEESNARQQRAMCGLTETVGFPPPEEEPKTEYGIRLRNQGAFAASAEGFNCTPTRGDNR